MAQPAIGMIETKGLIPLVHATDAMLKAANVQMRGWRKVGSGFCSCFVTGDVAAVKAAIDVGTGAVKEVGELVHAEVLAHPHEDLNIILP